MICDTVLRSMTTAQLHNMQEWAWNLATEIPELTHKTLAELNPQLNAIYEAVRLELITAALPTPPCEKSDPPGAETPRNRGKE